MLGLLASNMALWIPNIAPNRKPTTSKARYRHTDRASDRDSGVNAMAIIRAVTGITKPAAHAIQPPPVM